MRELLIVSDSAKGRSFRAALLSYATCSSFMTGGDVRPIWAMIACSEAESIPFIRNLQSGKKAKVLGERNEPTIDFLKSADYAYAAQRHPEGTVWTVYLPSLYRLDAGMVDPDGVKFAVLPRAEWLPEADERSAEALAKRYAPDRGQWHREEWSREEDAKRMGVARYVTRVAPLFCAYLDRRTRCPLIPDPLFYALVLGALLDKGLATLAHSDSYSSRAEWGRSGPAYHEHDVESVGLLPGVVCRADHAQLEPVLAECVREYETMRCARVSVPLAA